MSKYDIVIGLEVHLQIATKTKAFCGCKNEFGQEPNTSVCPVCLGFPGSLPVLNKLYLEYAAKVAKSLNCAIAKAMKFDRKNYFYPDLPKNYQISQFDMPLAENGYVEIAGSDNTVKRIRIKRVHMEEDAGKLMHDQGDFSLVDFNRCGTPLLEIVTEPDMFSSDEAYNYLTALKSILKYLDVSDCDMEKGSLRCDANISIKPSGTETLGVKVELKNMNSFKAVKTALDYEAQRQAEAIDDGESIIQETRLWDPDKKSTFPMRTKEQAHDYRYFPDPDLPIFEMSEAALDEMNIVMPELPAQKKERFIKQYTISEYDAGVLVLDRHFADYFESCVKIYPNSKLIVNWLMSEVLKYLNANNKEINDIKLSAKNFTGMLKLINDGNISAKTAKDILVEMILTQKTAEDIVKAKGLTQISDESEIKNIITCVIGQNAQAVNDYRNGKQASLAFLIGQIMKATKGKANPAVVNKLLKEAL